MWTHVLLCGLLVYILDFTRAALLPQLQGVFAVGDNAILLPIHCTKIIFQPSGKNAFNNTGYFYARDAGDYVFSCQNGTLIRYTAVKFLGQPGARPCGYTLFEDDALLTEHVHSKRRFRFWEKLPTSTNGTKELISQPSDEPAVVRARTSFFNEPLEYKLRNVTLMDVSNLMSPQKSRASVPLFSIVPVLHNKYAIVLLLNTDKKLIQLVTSSRLNQSETTKVLSEVPYPQGYTHININLRLNAKNASIEVNPFPSSDKEFKGNTYVQHNMSFRSWGYHDRLRVTIGLASSMTIITNLRPGLDPRRPGVPNISRAGTYYDPLPAVLGAKGTTDEVGGFGPLDYPLGLMQPMASLGFLDVTQPPFLADKTGQIDSSLNLQNAIDFAKFHYFGVFIPCGQYKVTRTIWGIQTTRILSTGDIPGLLKSGGFTHEFLLDGVSARYVPNYIRGCSSKNATIFVPPFTPYFSSSDQPRAVLDFRMINPVGNTEPNEQYNSAITSLGIKIGIGNIGAVGIRLRGAQGSGVEDVRVVFQGQTKNDTGLVGIVGGCGSGGSHHGITVVGGRYGLDLRYAQPASTITSVHLLKQHCGGVLYRGIETLTAVGVVIEAFKGGKAVWAGWPLEFSNNDDPCYLNEMPDDEQPTNGVIAGLMSWSDSSIEYNMRSKTDCEADNNKPNIAFMTNRSLFLENVYIKGANLIANFPDHILPAPSIQNWTLIKVLAHGVNPSSYASHPTWQLQTPVWIDGVRYPVSHPPLSSIKICQEDPPNFIRLHNWVEEDYPSFLSSFTINVREPPYNALGDGLNNDTHALQRALDAAATNSDRNTVLLPRGIYAIGGSGIKVPPGVALIGVGKHLSRIIAQNSFRCLPHNSSVCPLLTVEDQSLNNTMKPVILAFFSLTIWNSMENTAAVHWHGTGSARQLHFNRASRCGASPSAECHFQAVTIDHPIMSVSGVGASLKIWNFYLEDCCRNKTFPWLANDTNNINNHAFWGGWLAGPQGSKYRHIAVTDGAGPVDFYHLN